MSNRFSTIFQGSQYQHKPLDLIMQVGLKKDQEIQGLVDTTQDFINTSGNYETIYNADTDYKIQKNNELVSGLNSISKKKLDDPLVQNELRSQMNTFSNDKEVLGSIQRTNTARAFDARQKELGKDYRDQNALDFIKAQNIYQYGIPGTSEYEQAKNFLKLTPDIDPYYDYNKDAIEALSHIKDNGISYANGDFIYTTKGNFSTNNKNEILTDDRLGVLFSQGLSSEAYQQMHKDYEWEKYTKELPINEKTNQVISEDEWLGNKARAFQYEFSSHDQGMDYTGRSLGYYKEREKVVTPNTNPEYTPAQVFPSENVNWHIDSDGTLHSEYTTFDERNPENVVTNVLAELNPAIKYIPFAKFFTSVLAKLSIGDSPDEKSMDINEKKQYNDIRNIVTNKMQEDNPNVKLDEKSINIGMKNYMEEAKKMNNANLLINRYTDSKDIEEQSKLFFRPGVGKEAGNITLQGNYTNRKFFNNNGEYSGTQWIKNQGGRQPEVIGEFTPDNPYTSYGIPVQTSDGNIHFMEGDLNQVNSTQNSFSHDIYLSKYNNITNANYFNYGKAEVESHYLPKENSYKIIIKEGGKDYSYNVGGNNPDNVGTKESPIYLQSPEIFYSWLAQ